MEMIGTYYQNTERKIGDLENRIEMRFRETKEHFDLTVEHIRFELLGAKGDEIEVIKDRIKRLEKHTGLIAA